MSTTEKRAAYWREHIRLLAACLAVWFFVSFVCGIFLADVLNRFSLGGYPLGFWFAQQGSIYVFLLLILVYSRRMNALDRKYGFREED